MSEPDVSVIVVSWNSGQFLPHALDSIPDACGDLTCEVIVVDNGSEDGSVDDLRTRDVDLLTLAMNTGFTHAANLGASRARGRHLAFLNPDVVLTSRSLADLVAALERSPAAWAATPWFRNVDGSPQQFWRRLPTAVTAPLCFTHRGRRIDATLLRGRARRRHHYAELPDPPPTTPIETVGAACLVVRRAEFEAEGRFDERYLNFFQDTALARRMHRRGRYVLGVGAVEVTHHLGVTFRTLPPAEVHGQLLYALRQYLSDEPWWRRATGHAGVWLDTVGRHNDGHALRVLARRPV